MFFFLNFRNLGIIDKTNGFFQTILSNRQNEWYLFWTFEKDVLFSIIFDIPRISRNRLCWGATC